MTGALSQACGNVPRTAIAISHDIAKVYSEKPDAFLSPRAIVARVSAQRCCTRGGTKVGKYPRTGLNGALTCDPRLARCVYTSST